MSNRTTYLRKSTTYELGQGQKDFHTPEGVSQTIPDQTISLRELLEKHVRGQQIPSFKPQYSDMELPDIHKLDLVERQQLIEAAQREVKGITQSMQKAKEKREPKASEQVPETKPTA